MKKLILSLALLSTQAIADIDVSSTEQYLKGKADCSFYRDASTTQCIIGNSNTKIIIYKEGNTVSELAFKHELSTGKRGLKKLVNVYQPWFKNNLPNTASKLNNLKVTTYPNGDKYSTYVMKERGYYTMLVISNKYEVYRIMVTNYDPRKGWSNISKALPIQEL